MFSPLQCWVLETKPKEKEKDSVPFYKMLELIYDILFQIDKEIYHGRSNRKAADWIENEFNYNYYKPGYRTVTDKIMHLRSSANAIKAIYRTICDTNKKD